MFQTAILMTPELQSAVSLAENAIRLGWLKGDFDEATFNAFRQIIERGTEEVINTNLSLLLISSCASEWSCPLEILSEDFR